MLEVAQGGTARLTVEYKDENGVLTDPTTPLVDVLNPSNVAVVTDAVPVRESLGSFYYDFDVPSDAPIGEWTAHWTGTIDSSPLSGSDPFSVVAEGSITFGSTDLITLAEYRSLMGIGVQDERKDPQISALIPAASRAVRSYTGRTFELASGAVSDREFQYDESGILDVDDCTAITHIETDAGVVGNTYPLDSSQWTAMPQDDSAVFYYVIFHGGPYFGGSPEMGFKSNFDQYPYAAFIKPLVRVTATWGWDAIPEDVKLATAFTTAEFLGSPSSGGQSEGLTSEAIEGFSRAWGNRSGAQIALAVPNRARDLLVSYQRFNV